MNGTTCIVEGETTAYHFRLAVRELRLPKGFRLRIEQQPGSVTVEEFVQPWKGDGLPPVGIDCETLWSSITGEYVAVRVVGHDEDRAVVRFTCGDRKGEYDSDRQHNDYRYPVFRPLRTPEQLAQQQRLDAIQAMVDDSGFDGETDTVWPSMEALYNAGYRKVQP